MNKPTIPANTTLRIKGGECYGRMIVTTVDLVVGSQIEIVEKMWKVKSINRNTVRLETWHEKSWGDDELLERIYKF